MEHENEARLLEAARRTAEAIQEGDRAAAEAAFAPIYDAYYWRLNRYIRSRLRGVENAEEDARELTVKVLMVLWRQMGDFDPDPARGSLSGLVYKIAAREAAHHRREAIERQQKEQKAPDDVDDYLAIAERRAEHSGDPEADAVYHAEEAWRLDNRARLMQALKAESSIGFECLRLTYHAHLTCAEMAERLGISQAAARQRLVAARLKMFEVGWRLIREMHTDSRRRLLWYNPHRIEELAGIAAADPDVPSLFGEYFGAMSWHIVKPRRKGDGR